MVRSTSSGDTRAPRSEGREPRGALARIVPGLGLLGAYAASDLPHDIRAGLSVATVIVPAAIAQAGLVGVPAAMGLYSSILPLLAYALFGTSRQMVVGPSTALTALVGSAVVSLSGGGITDPALLAPPLAFAVGLSFLAARWLRLGAVAEFLPRPVLVGFMNGLALTIVGGQLSVLLGLSPLASGLAGPSELVRIINDVHEVTLLIGLGTMAAVVALPRVTPHVPAVLVAVLVSGLSVWMFDLQRYGVAVVGSISGGWPPFRAPPVRAEMLPILIAEGAGIALVSFANSVVVARSFATKNEQEVDPEQELIALGASNIVVALSQGFAVSGTNSRTAVAHASGGRTQLTGIVAAFVVAAVLLWFTGPLRFIPKAALAGVLIVAGYSLFDWRELVSIHRRDRPELVLSLLTTLGVITVGPIRAVLVVVVVALGRFVRLVSKPRVTILGSVDGHPGLYPLNGVESARPYAGVVLFRFDGVLVFFNARTFEREALKAADCAERGLRWFVLDMLPINLIDATGWLSLERVAQELRARGVRLAVAGREEEWLAAAGSGGGAALAQVHLFRDLSSAVDALTGST